ncbi:MAG: hypothetical protein ACRC11_22140 [Xenococcaceae cyanobacterium]
MYEILIKNQVSFAQVAAIFSNFMNISLDKIGTLDEYYNEPNTNHELEIGIRIIDYFGKGYKTYLDIDRLKLEIKDSELVKLACQLAETLETDVVIKDATDDEGFTYLIISKDKTYQKAYDSSKEEENIEFNPFTEKAELDGFLKALDDNQK